MAVTAEDLKEIMRCWVTGVTVVTSKFENLILGMTVNSLVSVSIDPPMISIILANNTRTKSLVDQSKIFGITILSEKQVEISDRFAGRIAEMEDRFEGVGTFTLLSGVPFIENGLAFMDCVVKYTYAMQFSTLYIGEVVATEQRNGTPLIYHNRHYHLLKE